MNAAIYARKSTEQNVADEAKSVGRQVENAKAFALAKGWTVVDEHVFVDDGVSGTEFEKRPGFMRMMGTLPRPPFARLIVSEQKSIGREMSETSYVIKRLAQAGVEIFEYVHGKSLTPTTAIAKLMSSVQGFSDEDHAVKSSERVIESHTGSVKVGHVVGGRVFGYRNQNVYNGVDVHGRPLKSHVERIIVDAQAAVVQRIFALYDSGEGLKRIAIQLNSEHAVCPEPFVRKDPMKVQPVGGWSPSTVRAILMRELYRGVIVWNRSRKRDDWRIVKQQPRPESDWIRLPVNEDLRIIDEPLWKRVQSRRQGAETLALRLTGGRLSGRPPKHATQNLLAGLASCAVCGGGLVVATSPRKRGRVPEYVCYRHRANGTCTNALHMNVADLNEAVLQAVEEHALTPEAIEQVIHLSERDDVTELQGKLAREQKDIAKRIERLIIAVEKAGDVESLAAKLRELEARQRAIVGEVASLRPVPRLPPAIINDRLAEWRRLLRASTTQGRTVLQRVLRGRLTFTPRADGCGYDFEGPTRFDKLFSGMACKPLAAASSFDDLVRDAGRGTEHIGVEDVPDADYGRLLERAYEKRVKVLASPTGFEPVFWP